MKSTARNPYVMAMFLGTALAFCPTEAHAGDGIPSKAIYDLSRYCTTCWRNARLPIDRWSDCTQEVLSRLLQRLRPSEWKTVLGTEGDGRREFLRAIDTVKKRVQRERKSNGFFDDQVPDRNDPDRQTTHEEVEAVRHAARERLTPRQQHILDMLFDGHGIADIADQLKVSPDRVSDEKYKAIQKLREHFQEVHA